MQEELLALLDGRRGHFRMESGYHSEWWFDLNALFAEPKKLQPYVSELARRLAHHRVQAICGPQTGGAKLASAIAQELGLDTFWSERFERPSPTGFFPVGYALPDSLREPARGKRIAIVDDAISAGSAVRGTHADLVACGAQPVALGALIVFGDKAANFAREAGLALEYIAPMSFGMWPPKECPLCRAGIPCEAVSDAV